MALESHDGLLAAVFDVFARIVGFRDALTRAGSRHHDMELAFLDHAGKGTLALAHSERFGGIVPNEFDGGALAFFC